MFLLALVSHLLVVANANPLPRRDASNNTARLAYISDAFQTGWDGYYKYAFPYDELLPVTNGKQNVALL